MRLLEDFKRHATPFPATGLEWIVAIGAACRTRDDVHRGSEREDWPIHRSARSAIQRPRFIPALSPRTPPQTAPVTGPTTGITEPAVAPKLAPATLKRMDPKCSPERARNSFQGISWS